MGWHHGGRAGGGRTFAPNYSPWIDSLGVVWRYKKVQWETGDVTASAIGSGFAATPDGGAYSGDLHQPYIGFWSGNGIGIRYPHIYGDTPGIGDYVEGGAWDLTVSSNPWGQPFPQAGPPGTWGFIWETDAILTLMNPWMPDELMLYGDFDEHMSIDDTFSTTYMMDFGWSDGYWGPSDSLIVGTNGAIFLNDTATSPTMPFPPYPDDYYWQNVATEIASAGPYKYAWDRPKIMPYFADFDPHVSTGNSFIGIKQYPDSSVYVKWNDVGFYDGHVSLTNTIECYIGLPYTISGSSGGWHKGG